MNGRLLEYHSHSLSLGAAGAGAVAVALRPVISLSALAEEEEEFDTPWLRQLGGRKIKTIKPGDNTYTAEAFIEEIHNEPRHRRKHASERKHGHSPTSLLSLRASSDPKFRRGQSLPGPYLLRISDRQIDR